jgi:hypothetical protein
MGAADENGDCDPTAHRDHSIPLSPTSRHELRRQTANRSASSKENNSIAPSEFHFKTTKE